MDYMKFTEYLITQDIYNQLFASVESGEGNLLRSDPETAEAQFHFLLLTLNRAKPKKVLETGTNKGSFSYVLSHILHDVDIYTFDLNPQSQACVDLLNRYQHNVRIHFTPGDTKQTLAAFNEPGIQFAWIDGGHDYDSAYSDMSHAARLGIPYIAMDDTKFPGMGHLNDVVHRIIAEHSEYRMGFNPFFDSDMRGAILIEKK